MKCARCEKEVKEGEALKKGDLVLCEDCYMREEEERNRCCCNPFSLRSYRLFNKRQAQGTKGNQVGGASGSRCQG